MRQRPRRFPPSGIYKYSLNQVESEMCQRRQNSVMLVDAYGKLKFSLKVKPNICPSPMAMSL